VGLIVIWRDNQQGIRTYGCGVFRQGCRTFRVVGAGTGDDRNPSVDVVNHRLNGLHFFLTGHCGCFSCGTADNDGVSIVGQMKIQQAFQCRGYSQRSSKME
jgi:hypothetical protein